LSIEPQWTQRAQRQWCLQDPGRSWRPGSSCGTATPARSPSAKSSHARIYPEHRICHPVHPQGQVQPLDQAPHPGCAQDHEADRQYQRCTNLDEFKQRLGIRSRAKTLTDLIKYLDTLPEQSWNVNKTFRSNSGKIRTVGIYDSSPTRTPQNSSNSSAAANTPSCA
jgi:hypothetical protein